MDKILLIILDGWGHNENTVGNAVYQANTPTLDYLYANYRWSLVEAAGEAVGLPDGQMGNSEVGHLNLGAGRVVYQELTRIGKCIETGEFYENPVFLEAIDRVRQNDSTLHLMGLVSDGGVHSHVDHLIALLEMARRQKINKVYIHAILDGRDTVPFGAGPFLEKVEQKAAEKATGRIATVCGRYYAMDRDKRWDRTERAYRAYVRGEGLQATSALEALEQAYNRKEGDEFVQPTVIVDEKGHPLTTVNSEDSLIFFNFRPDRARQITRTFLEKDFSHFDRGSNPPRPYLVTMTEYDREMPAPVAFTIDDLEQTLGEVYSRQGLTQMRIAETEKYAHVTFFFNGGREKPFSGEDRIMVPSPKVATYDLQPEMSAPAVTKKIVETVKAGKHDLIVANYANMDMVGHSGNLEAAIAAVEAVDQGIGKITREALPLGWQILIVGDHGNAEEMKDAKGATLTAHSGNPVPFILLNSSIVPGNGAGGRAGLREKGILADVAPTILDLAGLPVPEEMTGKSMVADKKLTTGRDYHGRSDS